MSDDQTVPTPDDAPATAPSRRGRLAPIIALVIALVCAGLFFVLAGADNDSSESADTPLMGRPAPHSIGVVNDEPFDLAQRKGSWVVLNFFDSTCIPCREEHPELVGFDESQQAMDSQGAELITVVYGDDEDNVQEFFDSNGGEWPVVYDEDGSISAAFGVNLVPETWILDPDGIIRWRTISTVTSVGLNEKLSELRALRG